MTRYLCPLCRATVLEASDEVTFERLDDGSLRIERSNIAAREAVLEEHFRSAHNMTPDEALKVVTWRTNVGRAISGALR